MGRAPCCDKANVKKGPWSPEEDAKLKAYIEQNGTGGNWIALPQKIGLKRCGKSCRLRWLNYLRPNIKHGGFSEEEDNIICSLYINIGSRWSIIAAQLPGRTDNDIKNYWNTRLKKKLLGKQRKEQQIRRANLRQEIKKENQNFMAPVAVDHVMNHQQTHHYWPELPSSSSLVMPMVNNNPNILNHDSHFLDQESLRNLLIKLGGRFSDDNNNNNQDSITNISNYPVDGSCTTDQDQPYLNMVSSSSSTATIVNNGAAAGSSLFQGLNDGFPVEFDELIYSNNNQQQLQGLESFYGSMEMGNGGSGISNGAISSGESSSWGNGSSHQLAYPQLVSEFESCLQSLPQDHSSNFEVSSYFGPQ